MSVVSFTPPTLDRYKKDASGPTGLSPELDRTRGKISSSCWESKHVQQNSTYPDAGYPDRLGPSGKFHDKSTKLTCPEITGYRIKYSTVLCLLELQIISGQKV
jgi:hypothetical protein